VYKSRDKAARGEELRKLIEILKLASEGVLLNATGLSEDEIKMYLENHWKYKQTKAEISKVKRDENPIGMKDDISCENPDLTLQTPSNQFKSPALAQLFARDLYEGGREKVDMPERGRLFPGYDVKLPAIAGPRTNFFPPPCFHNRAKTCANAFLPDRTMSAI